MFRGSRPSRTHHAIGIPRILATMDDAPSRFLRDIGARRFELVGFLAQNG